MQLRAGSALQLAYLLVAVDSAGFQNLPRQGQATSGSQKALSIVGLCKGFNKQEAVSVYHRFDQDDVCRLACDKFNLKLGSSLAALEITFRLELELPHTGSRDLDLNSKWSAYGGKTVSDRVFCPSCTTAQAWLRACRPLGSRARVSQTRPSLTRCLAS